MIESLKKAMLAGIGATAATKEKVEEALNQLVEKGKLTSEEAREVSDRILGDGKKEYESMRKDMEKFFSELAHKGNLVTQEQLESVKRRLTALERKLKDQD